MIFKGNTSAESRLTSVSSMKVDAEAQKDYNGHSAPFTSGCVKHAAVVV